MQHELTRVLSVSSCLTLFAVSSCLTLSVSSCLTLSVPSCLTLFLGSNVMFSMYDLDQHKGYVNHEYVVFPDPVTNWTTSTKVGY